MLGILPAEMFIAIFAVSLIICGTLVQLHPLLPEILRGRDDLKSVQCTHMRSTSRVGGVGVLVATLLAFVLVIPDHQHRFFTLFGLTLLPVFIAGLAEDLGWRVSAMGRLFGAASSAALAIMLLKLWIPPLAIPGIDAMIGFTPMAIAITILWATGVCHAINLIDGVNGLAGGTGILIAAGIALLAEQAGADGFAIAAVSIIPALAGFLVFNWPLGRIFLGDAGAYSLGHVLVWLALGLAWMHPQISALALSLMFFWPVADTLLAIFRRGRAGRPIGEPDRLHFHQFVMRALVLLGRGRLGKGAANSLTSIIMLPLIAAPIGAGVYLWDRPVTALVAWAVFGTLFTATYIIGVRLFRSNRWRALTQLSEPNPARFKAPN